MQTMRTMALVVTGLAASCGPATPGAHRPVDNDVAAQGAGETGVGHTPSSHGAARVVRRTATGGELALDGDREDAMEDATAQMTEVCGRDNYRIISEGEQVVGSDQADGSAAAPVAVGEWRMSYECMP